MSNSIPIFVINLDCAKNRLSKMSEQFSRLNRSFIRWPATPGDELDSKKFGVMPVMDGIYITGFREWSKNEAACGVSHIRIYQKMVSEEIPWAIVLEDDAVILNNLPLRIEDINVPSDAEIILINERSLGKDSPENQDGYSYSHVIGGAGTDGYIISLKGARKMLKILCPLRDPLDFQMFSHFRSVQENDKPPYYWRLPQNPEARDVLLNAYKIYPDLIRQNIDNSTIGGQRHPRARYYCRVLLNLDMPELNMYYSSMLGENEAKAVHGENVVNVENYRAVDISHFDEELKYYYNKDSQPMPAMRILRLCGVNCVRISIWVGDDTIFNLKRAFYLAKLAKAEGLKIYLVLHYSDNWADPTHQKKPKEWAKFSFVELCQVLYNYTQSVLKEMIKNEIYPEIVQIGNEVTSGILWAESENDCGGQLYERKDYDGQLIISDKRWNDFSQLMSYASKAVRDVKYPNGTSPKIMIQIDKGAFPEQAVWWFEKARTFNLDYDIIGLSYYYLWHHATIEELSRLSCVSISFPDKEIMIAETSYPYKHAEGITIEPTISGPDYSISGQAKYIRELQAEIAKFDNSCGFCWWGAFFLNDKYDRIEKLFQAQALFDENGVALEGLFAFKNQKENK